MRLYKLKASRESGFSKGLSGMEYLRILVEWIGISLLAAWLLYDAVWGFFLLLPGIFLWKKFRGKAFEEKRIRRYALQFKEGMALADKNNCIDVYVSEDHEDVTGDNVWQNFFSVPDS